ncbi:hypothetical protein KJ059_12930 [Myxococcota bacterium]|nr:hypothetical protein [Myxococcota bacterium]
MARARNELLDSRRVIGRRPSLFDGRQRRGGDHYRLGSRAVADHALGFRLDGSHGLWLAARERRGGTPSSDTRH